MDEYEGIPDHHNPLYNNDNIGIESLCQSFSSDENYHFYLRVHPNLKDIDNAQNKAITALGAKFTNLTIIGAGEKIDTYALMDAVDLVITFGSTMGAEAFFWKKPSLLLGRAFYEGIKGIIQPTSHEEVIELIKNIPSVAANEDILKYGYWIVTFGTKFTYFKPDGLFSGAFLEKRIMPSVVSRIKSKVSIILGEN
jgi:hypothetical protein